MTKAILQMLIGAIIGASVFYLLQQSTDLEATSFNSAKTQTANLSLKQRATPTTPSLSDRISFYQLAASADENELLTLLDEISALPESRRKAFAMEVLLSRYAESSPGEAIRLSKQHSRNRSLTASLYAIWASIDSQSALRQFAEESDRTTARYAGLALLDELGGDDTALETVIESLPSALDETAFRIEVVAESAKSDPAYALSELAVFEPTDRSRAVLRIAGVLGSQDPLGAMAVAEMIEHEEERALFKSQVLRALAHADPLVAIEYFQELSSSTAQEQMLSSDLFMILAKSNPRELLAATEDQSTPYGSTAAHFALLEFATESPADALEYVKNRAPGRQQQQMLQMVAQGYAKHDPEAALEWATNLQPRPHCVMQGVIAGISQDDPDRAFDMAVGLDNANAKFEAVNAVVMSAAYRDGGASAMSIADRVLALPAGELRGHSLQYLSTFWAQSDPKSAIEWTLANSDKLPGGTLSNVARQLAEVDPRLAAAYTSQVPDSSRPEWIRQVASGYAENNPAEALAWIEQFNGQPGYDRAQVSIAQQAARSDPVAVARRVQTISDPQQAAAVASVAANAWAAQDSVSAAQWAGKISNPEVREAAIQSVAGQWASVDVAGARQWAMSMSAGTSRDNALSSVVSGLARRGIPDEQILNAFSDDLAKQRAVTNAVYQIARRDQDAAIRLIEKHVTDPSIRYELDKNMSRIVTWQ